MEYIVHGSKNQNMEYIVHGSKNQNMEYIVHGSKNQNMEYIVHGSKNQNMEYIVHGSKNQNMEYTVHGSKNQDDSKLKLTLERFAWNDATFRSVTTDLGHACLWLDPDTGGRIWEAIYIKQQGPTMNRDQGYQLPPIYTQILPPVSGSSHRHAWPRSVVTDRNVASFQANRSKISFNLLSPL